MANRMGLTLQFIISMAGLLTTQMQTAAAEFSLVENIGTFLQGQNDCKEMNGTLATFVNKADNDAVLSDFSSFAGQVWIGLYDNMSSWTWSLGKAVFENGQDFSSWANSEPQLSVVAKICVQMDQDGFWSDELCTEAKPAVCYYVPGPAHYILVTVPMTWEQAQEYCRLHYTDLASVRTQKELNDIRLLLTEASWIGLFREGWGKWSDQTLRGFTNFRSQDLALNQTSTDSLNCATANTLTGLWSKVSCDSNSAALCKDFVQSPLLTTTQTPFSGSTSNSHSESVESGSHEGSGEAPAQTTVVPSSSKNTLKLRLQSDTDLNDPSVQDRILRQLQGNLDNNGLAELKLHWIHADGKVFHKEATKNNPVCR